MNRVDVRGLASRQGISVEEAGRRARYAFFEEVRALVGARVIATAHQQDDEIETFFLRLFRGSSLAGLKGIPPVRGRIIRPLIEARRTEILHFLDDEKIPYRLDPTNLETTPDRNFVRNRLIPTITERFPDFARPLQRTLDRAREEDDFLDEQAKRLYSATVLSMEDGLVIKAADLVQAPPVLASRVILAALYTLAGPDVRFTRTHLESILKILRSDRPSSKISLPGEVSLLRQYHRLLLTKGPTQERSPIAPVSVAGPGTIELPEMGIAIRFRVFADKHDVAEFPDGRKRALFDADKIPFPLTIRSPAAGDRFRPWGMQGTRKLKKVLIDLKVPVQQRITLPLLVKEGRILWIAGIRRSSEAPIGLGTNRILEVSLE
jgi:tRNA(Ile)-lysidine synthase